MWELSHCTEEEREKWIRLAEQTLPPQVAAYITDKREKISIIISAYNTEKYLRQCLDSVVSQTLKEIEIICVNDGSTDGSLGILREYAKKDSRVVLISQKNKGLSFSRNNALKIARGEYVQFVDSDDLIREDTCEKLYKNAKENNLDMLCFLGYNFTESPKIRQKNPYWSYDRILLLLDGKKIFNIRDVKEKICRMIVSSCLTLYRNAFLKRHNIEFPLGLRYEDNIFYLKALTKAVRVSIDPEEYYMRRLREDSITQNLRENFSDYFEITDIALEYLRSIHIDESVYNAYRKEKLDWCVRLYQLYGDGACKKKYYLRLKKLISKYNGTSEYLQGSQDSSHYYAYVFLPITFFKSKVLKHRLCQHILTRMSVLRIDIKNVGTEENAVAIEAENSAVSKPGWFSGGQVLTSSTEKGKIKISIITSGKLMLVFRGPDVRFEGKRFPLWNDYKSIKIDGKEILSSPVAVWHDKPWSYEMSVKDGQEVWIEYEQQPHSYSRKELKNTILKLNPTSEVIHKNIDALTEKIEKMINQAK